MHDVDHNALYRQAEAQAGYFTTRQAVEAGMDRSTLRHHAREGGRYIRVRRGLYRLRNFPTTPHEQVMAAWLPLREAGAVVSHESALELHGLSDLIPDAIHLSLSRTGRGQRRRPGVRLHTLAHAPTQAEMVQIEGVPATRPERTIVDVLESGAQPEQVGMAIDQALKRGLTTPQRLTATASTRTPRVRSFVERHLAEASR